MHDSMVRLYEAARRKKGIAGQSALATVLGESPQAVNNWEARGVSQAGALKAQARLGCNANWLLSGKGEMSPGWPFSSELQSAVILLDTAALLRIENLIRAHLGMPPHQPQEEDAEATEADHAVFDAAQKDLRKLTTPKRGRKSA